MSQKTPGRQTVWKVNPLWLAVPLFIVAILPYFGVWNFEFVTFDDPRYILENPQVTAGVTLDSVKWAFTSGYASNWHPLTWISHMLDVELFGLGAGGHHLTSVLLHGVNTVLLFGFLARATGCYGRSALVAALFAVHPLHVESVAWVSERKDVLSTLFMMLTLWAYLAFTKRPALGRYLLVLVLFALGLMAKPMLVTLPFVLLLLDGWPLERLKLDPFDRVTALSLAKEKLPFFALAAVSSVVTFLVQQEGGAVASIDGVPAMLRVANASVSYVEYILNMLVPVGLTALYPFPESIPIWKSLGSAVILITVSLAAIKVRGNFSYLTVGWFLFLGTLVPVIGIIQVGSQALADRYTYIPMIGLFIMIAWGGYDLLGKNSSKQAPLAISAILIVTALATTSWMQARYWQNSNILWLRALEVTENNFRAHTAYGSLLVEKGQLAKAVPHFKKAAQIQPSYAEVHNKLGSALSDLGKPAEAIEHYENALRAQPGFAEAHNNLGNALTAVGRPEDALEQFNSAISSKPDYATPHNGKGSALDDLGRVDEAIAQYQQAIQIDSQYTAAHNNLATAYYKQGKLKEAIEESRLVLKLEPRNSSFHYNHGVYMFYSKDFKAARKHLEEALRLNPDNASALKALRMLPDSSDSHQ